MLYVTGIHALNIQCNLETCGDWHTSALKWKNISFNESDYSIFGDYGIEKDKIIPEHSEKYYVANHIRALLDLLEKGFFTVAQGMKNDFICNDKYDDIIFNKTLELQFNDNWFEIDKFMEKEYLMKWVNFKRSFNNV